MSSIRTLYLAYFSLVCYMVVDSSHGESIAHASLEVPVFFPFPFELA